MTKCRQCPLEISDDIRMRCTHIATTMQCNIKYYAILLNITLVVIAELEGEATNLDAQVAEHLTCNTHHMAHSQPMHGGTIHPPPHSPHYQSGPHVVN